MTTQYNEAYRKKEYDYLLSFNNPPLAKFIVSLLDDKYSKAKVYHPNTLAKFNQILSAEKYSKQIDTQLKALFGFTSEEIPGEQIFTQGQPYQAKLYQQLAKSKSELAKQLKQLGVILTEEKVLALTVGGIRETATPQMNATQGRLIEYAFETEVENNKNRNAAFRNALLENPFTYDGINAVLKTLAPEEKAYLAPQLSDIYKNADTEILTTVLEGLKKTKEQRQLIREAFKPSILKASQNQVENFEQQLTTSALNTVDKINNIIKTVKPNFKLPEAIKDENFNDFLKKLPVLNSQKDLLRKKITNELTEENKVAFENALEQMSDFTFESVNDVLAKLGVTPPLELPEHDNIEIAVQLLPGLSSTEQQIINNKVKNEITDENQSAFQQALINPSARFNLNGINTVLKSLDGTPVLEIKTKNPDDKEELTQAINNLPGLTRKQEVLLNEVIGPRLNKLINENQLSGEDIKAYSQALYSPEAKFTRDYINQNLLSHTDIKLAEGDNTPDAIIKDLEESRLPEKIIDLEVTESPKKEGMITLVIKRFTNFLKKSATPHAKKGGYQPLEEVPEKAETIEPTTKKPNVFKRSYTAISHFILSNKQLNSTTKNLTKRVFGTKQPEEKKPLLGKRAVESQEEATEIVETENIPDLLFNPSLKTPEHKIVSDQRTTTRSVSKQEKQNLINGILRSANEDIFEKLLVNTENQTEFVEIKGSEEISKLAERKENFTYRMITNKEKHHEITYNMEENEYTINETDPEIFVKLCRLAKNCNHPTVNIDQLPQGIKAKAWVVFTHEGLGIEGTYQPADTQKEKYEKELDGYLKTVPKKHAYKQPTLTPFSDRK